MQSDPRIETQRMSSFLGCCRCFTRRRSSDGRRQSGSGARHPTGRQSCTAAAATMPRAPAHSEKGRLGQTWIPDTRVLERMQESEQRPLEVKRVGCKGSRE
eukprot:365765-Rhodomonas_salina.1